MRFSHVHPGRWRLNVGVQSLDRAGLLRILPVDCNLGQKYTSSWWLVPRDIYYSLVQCNDARLPHLQALTPRQAYYQTALEQCRRKVVFTPLSRS